ncbi:hypothetical protein [Spirosoma utsteinense]|uniref:Uncharacterized protein n=1 Tax=Spirosoma utsteinense TaxID=2585773 RepID=A0ABR6WCY2_9BACT|nr:hypothetical protein [Spirosoma utsteinense]MBC3787485.1 hypothetical protein [Spirosoma utsteinense]MBC3794422.1 hypothetical protein [Spirosoma utsteinense]
MINRPLIQRSPESGQEDTPSKYDPEFSESLKQTKKNNSPITSSPDQTPYVGSHADNYAPDQEPEHDGPSGENTKNGGEQGGGLWTSGGKVTTGTPYHDEDDETD